MNKVICIFICSLLCLTFNAQVNLVIDPSFENNDSCDSFMFIRGTKDWHSLDSINNTISSSHYTPVYLNTCDTSPGSSGACPLNYAYSSSYKYPRTGNGMYQEVFHLDFSANPGYNRDYLRGRMRNKLINGKQYCGKYYVSLFKSMKYGTDRLCAVVDNGGLDVNPCNQPIVATPTWENSAFNYITDTTDWTRIQGVFTANGTENFITIGNFYSDANTHKTIFNASSIWPDAVYYMDDVSIIATEITAYAGNDATICLTDSIHLGRPQEVGLECLWYKPTIAIPFASTSDIWFKPTQTGTYTFIQRMDNCAITWDTVNIAVIQDCSLLLPTKEIPNVFTPNGDRVNDVFSFTFNGTLTNFSLYNRWGNIIQTTNNQSHTTMLWDGRTTSGEACSEGVYFYTLEYKDSKGDVIKKNGYVSLLR